jgi:hypothetical protein
MFSLSYGLVESQGSAEFAVSLIEERLDIAYDGRGGCVVVELARGRLEGFEI